ncbi:MAG TPA: hypothetical protein VFU21_26690 [Kofleriaceae bacterium]|nr:hypothetical protein [Kofleriaceae bacterium]
MTCSLATALRYRNRHLIDRFVEHYKVSPQEAREIFAETKKWLWLNTLPGAPAMYIGSAMVIIDEMWHTFVLFTEDYTEYCRSTFGRYLHHRPTTETEKRREKRQRERDPVGHARRRRRQMEKQYRFIAEHLGEATLRRWFVDYPLRYDRRFFARFGIEVPDFGAEVAGQLAALRDGERAPA